jgi:hypothetical protein
MKSLVAIALLLVAGCANAQSIKTSGSDTNPGYIRVIGNGSTLEQAKQNGFHVAIEIAVGSIILADTETKNNQLVRNDILNHSSGYIDDYKIVNKISNDGNIQLIMDVQVKSSKIANRVLNKGSDIGVIEGDKLYVQYLTYSNERTTGDQLLKTVLRDYPTKAFDVTVGKIDFVLDAQRNPIAQVPIKIKWSYNYLTALNEALSVTSDKDETNSEQQRIFITSKDPNAWLLGKTNRYYFNDRIRSDLIKNSLVSYVSVYLTFLDYSGDKIIEGCGYTVNMNGPNVTEPMPINGNSVVEEHLLASFKGKDVTNISRIAKVNATIRAGQCSNYEMK